MRSNKLEDGVATFKRILHTVHIVDQRRQTSSGREIGLRRLVDFEEASLERSELRCGQF
jgi:hypothetical protein